MCEGKVGKIVEFCSLVNKLNSDIFIWEGLLWLSGRGEALQGGNCTFLQLKTENLKFSG